MSGMSLGLLVMINRYAVHTHKINDNDFIIIFLQMKKVVTS